MTILHKLVYTVRKELEVARLPPMLYVTRVGRGSFDVWPMFSKSVPANSIARPVWLFPLG